MGKAIKALLDEGIAVTVIDSRDIVCEAMRIHALSPVACVALGRALTVCAMMGTELKGENDSMTAVISGDGPLGKITVCADSKGVVKGYAENPAVTSFVTSQGKLDIPRAVGRNGRLTVVKSMGLKEPYVGSANLFNGEISDDFAAYFYHSEQRAAAVTAGIVMEDNKCVAAVGILMRVLPNCTQEAMEKLNKLLTEIKSVDYSCGDIDILMEKVFNVFTVRRIDELQSGYLCDCSNERIEKVILSLGRGEIFNILVEQGKIEITCDFCRKKYSYDKEQVIALLNPGTYKS